MKLNLDNIDELPLTNKELWCINGDPRNDLFEMISYYRILHDENKQIDEQIDSNDHILWHNFDFYREGMGIHYE